MYRAYRDYRHSYYTVNEILLEFIVSHVNHFADYASSSVSYTVTFGKYNAEASYELMRVQI